MTATIETPAAAPTSPTFDEARAEQFAGRVIGLLNDGSLALLCSLGHRLGLFDALARLDEATSTQIADATGFNERYVREWLGGATTGGIVEYDPEAGTYHLPPEHAASLTHAAGPDNLARLVGFVPLLAQVEEEVSRAFRDGGGVPYTAYERFHQLMADMSGEVFDAALIDTIVPLVDGLDERLTAGIDVADIGCGSGHAINLLAQAYPASRFVGYDFSEEAIEVARAEARALGVDNARFEVQDVAQLSSPPGFDLITAFDAIHDQAQPGQVLSCIHEALRPGGTFLMGDIKASSHLQENLEIPWANFLYTVSLMHCMTVSLALDGEGLGTVWGEQKARGMLDDAGFINVQVRELEQDPINSYYVATKA